MESFAVIQFEATVGNQPNFGEISYLQHFVYSKNGNYKSGKNI